MRRLVALTALAALVVLDAGAAVAADPTFPTGSFTVDRTTAEVGWDPETGYTATFQISGTATDDATPSEQIEREILPGNGWGALPWTGDGPFVLDYAARTGTHHPLVRLTDGDGHVTLVDLPALTVTADRVAPLLLIDPPARSREHRVSAWRTIHLTAADYESGLAQVTVGVIQRRGARWYVYGFERRRWTRMPRGTTRLGATAAIYRVHPRRLGTAVRTGPESYRSPRIAGLTRGRLVVIAMADDHGFGYTHRETTIDLRRR